MALSRYMRARKDYWESSSFTPVTDWGRRREERRLRAQDRAREYLYAVVEQIEEKAKQTVNDPNPIR
jgi:hypothetical protein